MRFVFHKDPDGKNHMWNRHRVSAQEVIQAFPNVRQQWQDGTAMVRVCLADHGKLMKIVYREQKASIFIITAFYTQ
jgi:hypothetical protein